MVEQHANHADAVLAVDENPMVNASANQAHQRNDALVGAVVGANRNVLQSHV